MSSWSIMLALAIAAVVGYFVGSINPAAIIARVRGVDIHSSGSGNPGATNTGRVLGVRFGILVGAIDILKGFLPAALFQLMFGELAAAVAGLAAVLGHVTSPYLRGRGGKGVATALGAILGVAPWLAVPVLMVFFVVVALTRTIGVAATAGAVTLLIAGIACFFINAPLTGVFAMLLAAIVLSRHRRNIVAAITRSTGD